jgi:hypothetical protein
VYAVIGITALKREGEKEETHLLRTTILLTRNNRLTHRRIHREFRHPPPQLRQFSSIIERPERIQQIQRANERVPRWRVEEIESDEVVDTEGFEHEDDGAEVRPLDFGDGVLVEFVLVGVFGVEAETLSGSDATRTTGSLTGSGTRALYTRQGSQRRSSRDGRGGTNGSNDERFHSVARVVRVLLDETWVDDVNHTVDGDGSFGDVGSENDLEEGSTRRKNQLEEEEQRRRAEKRTFLAPSGVGSKILACISVGKFA